MSRSLAEAWSALCTLILPAAKMDVPSPIPLLLSPHREWDTELFLSILQDQASHGADSLPLTSISFRKQRTDAEHEFLVFEVSSPLQARRFVLERTVDVESPPNQATVEDFLDHTESKALMDKVLDAIAPLSASASVSLAAAVAAGPAAAVALASTLPLSSSTPSPLLPSTARVASTSIGYSLFDRASMKMAEVLHAVSGTPIGAYASNRLNKQKPPNDSRAEDRFVGENRLLLREYESGAHIGEFRPQALTLFHLALLAHIVHMEYPLYSLFLSQCYWFSSTIFYAAQRIDRDLSTRAHVDLLLMDPRETDDFFLPFDLYVPDQAGRWKGIKISGCKAVVVSMIVKKFHLQLRELATKVFVYHFFRITIC